jgi:hypothetical protein
LMRGAVNRVSVSRAGAGKTAGADLAFE